MLTKQYWVVMNHRRSGPFSTRLNAEQFAIQVAPQLNTNRYESIVIKEEEHEDEEEGATND